MAAATAARTARASTEVSRTPVRASAKETKGAGPMGRRLQSPVVQRKECNMNRAGLSLLAAGAMCAANITVAYADPPPWAPAHGWRDKHDDDHDEHRHKHHHDHVVYERIYVMPWRGQAPA